jgi:hypothetical protein
MFSKKKIPRNNHTFALYNLRGSQGSKRTRLPPHITYCLRADVFLCVDAPLGNVVACGSRDWEVLILHHHPLEEFVAHFTLEGLVEAGINRLDKPRAASRDELNQHAEGLDGIDDCPHLVDSKLVQEEDGNDPWQRRCNVGGKDVLDPIKHDLLIKPHLFIEALDAARGEGGNLPACDRSVECNNQQEC